MNIEKLNEMADYLDKGDFGGRNFHMDTYQDCVLGHCAVRELQSQGKPETFETIALGVDGISMRVFGISQSKDTETWTFAFGALWGSDPHAAAKRLRYLALHGGAPDKSVWDTYHSATDEKAVAQYVPAATMPWPDNDPDYGPFAPEEPEFVGRTREGDAVFYTTV